MIVFDLQCESRHGFEAWFASTEAYERQREAGLVECPCCGSTAVCKAVMAPRLAPSNSSDITDLAQILPQIAAMQAEMLKRSTWVGEKFVDQARAMADGDAESKPIHGTATPAQASALREEGVPVMPLLLPVVPPEALN